MGGKRLSYEEVKRFVEVESGSGCELISESYLNTRSRLKFKCSCGEAFETEWRSFLSERVNKRQCDSCGSSTGATKRRDTLEAIKRFVNAESDCELISREYEHSHAKLKFKCKCGESFETLWGNFKNSNKRRCKKCSKELLCNHFRLDFDEAKEYIEKESECKLDSIYYEEDRRANLKLNCACGTLYDVSWGNFRYHNQRQCKDCSYIHPKYQDVKDFIESESRCKLISKEYINSKEEILLKCGCSELFTVTFSEFKNRNKRKCNTCSHKNSAEKRRVPYKEIKNFIEQEKNGGFKLLTLESDYINSRSPLSLQCLCGEEYDANWNYFRKNLNKCPSCSPKSKGEECVILYLSKMKIKYKKEKKFKDCRSYNLLPFDFYINRKIIVEYDGTPHFSPKFSGETFESTKINDKIKNQYCIENNIPLIRIPYWEFNNIESILENTLIHFGLIESNPNYDNSKVLEYLVDENWNHDKYIAKCPKNIKEQDKSVLITT